MDPGTPPLSEPAESIQGLSLHPRDFVVFSGEDQEIDLDCRIGRYTLTDSGLVVAAIAVACVDGRLLVGVPEAVWSKTASVRLLPPKSLSKPILCSVASCLGSSRLVLDDAKPPCRVWFGLADAAFEGSLDFIFEEAVAYLCYCRVWLP